MAAIGSESNMSALPGLADMFGRYVRSTSTRTAAFVGLLTYASYAYAHGSWTNPALIGVSLFTGLFLPTYAKLSNKAELWAQNQFGFVTAGRLGRFVPQYAFNRAVFWVFYGVPSTGGRGVGGRVRGSPLVTSLASQGSQYLGLFLFQRGIGDANRNVLPASRSTCCWRRSARPAFPRARGADRGLRARLRPVRRGLLSDIRFGVAPKGGIRLFFGTFNPSTIPIDIVRRASGAGPSGDHPSDLDTAHSCRCLPPAGSCASGENGFQIYEDREGRRQRRLLPRRTQFPPPERAGADRLAVAEAGLGNRVEVAFYPDVYNAKGFRGVIGEVRKQYPGVRLHALHGTDFGGMTVRQICDECGWIYPWRILRRDKVSATAIRRGAKGMTSGVVTDVLGQLTANRPEVTAGGRRFRNDNGVLTEGN